MNCCFVSFFIGRGKGMNFLPYVSVQCPACSAESFFKVSVESTAFSVFCCRAATASPFPISSFSQGYTGFREWYRCGSLRLPSPYAGTVSPFRSPEYGHAQEFVVTGINVWMEYPDTIRAEKQPEVLPCLSSHGDNRHDPAVFHYHHSYPSSKSARSGRASSPSRTRL